MPANTSEEQLQAAKRFLYKITLDMCVRQPERSEYLKRPVTNTEFANDASGRYLMELMQLIEADRKQLYTALEAHSGVYYTHITGMDGQYQSVKAVPIEAIKGVFNMKEEKAETL